MHNGKANPPLSSSGPICTEAPLTVAGRSQHLSLVVQPKLQTISNIWSWNCRREEKRSRDGCYRWLPLTPSNGECKNMATCAGPTVHWAGNKQVFCATIRPALGNLQWVDSPRFNSPLMDKKLSKTMVFFDSLK